MRLARLALPTYLGRPRACRLVRFAVVGALTVGAIFSIERGYAQGSDEAQSAQVKEHTPGVVPVRPRHDVPIVSVPARGGRPVGNSTITPGPAGAHLTYYGGPVVSSIKVAVVYYGNGSYLPALSTGLPSFFTAVTNGTYMDMLSEYSTQGVAYSGGTGNEYLQRGGPNAYLGSFTITPSAGNNGSTITDAQIQSEIQAQINSGHLPAPVYDANGNADTLYMTYFPAGKTITQGSSSSCVSGGFCAYHGTINSGGRNILYGVQPDMQAGSGCSTGCGNSATSFNNYTSVASHEFAETITDAAVGLATVIGPPLAWYDSTNGENGDICNAIQGTADGYTVQAEWSNLQNGCALGPVTFTVTAPASATAGAGVSVGVTAKNSAGATLTAYRGKVHFTSTDGSATLPADYTFTATDNGLHTFAGVILRTVGNQTVTATGAVSTGFHGTSGTISVTSGTVGNDFSIAASPASLSLVAGTTGTSTIATAVISGSAATVSLAASGAPAGVTTTLNPTSVTAGGSSTLTVATTTAAAAGTYTLTVTGTEGSATHAANVGLTLTASGGGGGGLTNGGFESGLTGWTAAGASETAVTSGCRTGSGCAQLGGTVATNGDSSLTQTFTAPTGATGLSFWYKMSCPDTVTYDWATVTLKDNTAGTTATPLGKTCATSSVYVNGTASLTAGHSYTLTLTSHDDNYAGDPTYTFYDDVTITTSAPPPPGGITNGGFESGATGWKFTGAASSIVTSGCHGGTSCLELGSGAATNGDSSFAQTFTVPAGKTSLSFWYKMTCPDTVTYDWATVTLGATTVLPKTCATSSVWVNKTAAVTAGSTYTLTLTSHDDNYSSDPTFTLYDDVTLN